MDKLTDSQLFEMYMAYSSYFLVKINDEHRKYVLEIISIQMKKNYDTLNKYRINDIEEEDEDIEDVDF